MGATVISFVGDRTAPLAAVSDYVVENAACNDNLVEELHIQFFALGARLMLKTESFLSTNGLWKHFGRCRRYC